MIQAATIEAVAGLKARFNAPYSPADRELIKELYQSVLGKTLRNTGCQNCYHDAVIELHLHIKRATMKETAQLKAGAVICCPAFHNGTIFTNENITDDIAREYLAQFPERAHLFAAFPSKVKKPRATKKSTANTKETE